MYLERGAKKNDVGQGEFNKSSGWQDKIHFESRGWIGAGRVGAGQVNFRVCRDGADNPFSGLCNP